MFDAPGEIAGLVPAFVRAEAGVRVRYARIATPAGSRTVRTQAAEWGGFRARFPDAFTPVCETVLVNTGGGMTGGDRFDADFALDAGAEAVITTQAAEKIYKSQGPATTVASRIVLGDGASLVWAPQEAILFSGANLVRSLTIDTAADARLVACESIYFGRSAMGEALDEARLKDSWRVRRDGRLIFADDVLLEGAFNLALQRKAIANGARAAATVLMVAPDAPAQVDKARAAMEGCPCEWGVSGYDGLMIARLLGPDAAALRAALARLITHLSQRPLPRSWQT